MLLLLSLMIQKVKMTRLCGLLWKNKKRHVNTACWFSKQHIKIIYFFFPEVFFLLPFCCLPKEAVDYDEVTPQPPLLQGEQTN